MAEYGEDVQDEFNKIEKVCWNSDVTKAVFEETGLDGYDDCDLITIARSHLKKHRVAGCDACDQEAVIGIHMMKHKEFEL